MYATGRRPIRAKNPDALSLYFWGPCSARMSFAQRSVAKFGKRELSRHLLSGGNSRSLWPIALSDYFRNDVEGFGIGCARTTRRRTPTIAYDVPGPGPFRKRFASYSRGRREDLSGPCKFWISRRTSMNNFQLSAPQSPVIIVERHRHENVARVSTCARSMTPTSSSSPSLFRSGRQAAARAFCDRSFEMRHIDACTLRRSVIRMNLRYMSRCCSTLVGSSERGSITALLIPSHHCPSAFLFESWNE